MPSVASRADGILSAREFVFLRYAIALAPLLVLWPWLPGRLPSGRDFWRTVVMGVAVFNLGHLLQIAGIQLGRASDASILLALDPLVASIGAAIFLHERIPARRWAGFGLAIGGMIALSAGRGEGRLPGLGANLLVLLSFVSEAVWSVTGKPLITRWGIPKVTALALASGTVANAALLLDDPAGHAAAIAQAPAEAWISLAFLGIVLSAFGYSAWHMVIREAPVSVASMTVYLQPILGSAMAVMWAGDSLHAGHFAGAALIITGLVVGIRGQPSAGVIAVAPEK